MVAGVIGLLRKIKAGIVIDRFYRGWHHRPFHTAIRIIHGSEILPHIAGDVGSRQEICDIHGDVGDVPELPRAGWLETLTASI
jgi:hypothetical protein